jgi:undecaprenyl-diphosphatase
MVYALTLGEVLNAISRWDTAWFYMINLGTQNRIFDLIMPILSDIKLWRWPLAIVALGAVLLGNRRVKVTVLLAVILLVLSDQISSHLLKPLVARQRPSHVLEGVRLLVPRGGRLSFPSSHASNVFAIWKLIAVRHAQLAPYLLIIALGVACSRVYVGVHYPLDVVGGAILGVLLATGVLEISELAVFRPLARRRRAKARRRDRERKDR